MKILVFSDSHGNTDRMRDAIAAHGASVSLIVHLGDGVRDIEYVSSFYPDIPVISVHGNGESAVRDVKLIDEEGVRFMCMHGHTFGVKRDVVLAAEYAAEQGADVLLFGHTHTPEDRTVVLSGDREVRVFNPGSIGAWHPSYGVICIPRRGVYVTSHAYPL